MPNDAKLGLLTGVLGVIVAAIISVKSPAAPVPPPPTTQTATPQSSEKRDAGKPVADKPVAVRNPEPSMPATLPTNLATTPVVRTKKDVEATPAARATREDEEP